MLYSQSPPLTAEDTSFGGHERDPDVRSDQRMGRRRMKPSINSPYPYRFGEGQPAIKPAVDWQANVPYPYPLLHCSSHRCRRHAWLAILRRRSKGHAGSRGSDTGLGAIVRSDDEAVSRGCNFHRPDAAACAPGIHARCRAAQRRTTRCQARTDGPEHCGTTGCRGGRQAEDIVSAFGPSPSPAGRLDPAAQTSASQDRTLACRLLPDHYSRADGPDLPETELINARPRGRGAFGMSEAELWSR